MSVKLVVFDMAGTTVEDRDFVHQALIDALKDENIHVSRDEANQVMGYPKPVAIDQLLYSKDPENYKRDDAYITKVHDNFVGRMIDFYTSDPMVKSKDGAEETFEQLKARGIKVALDTGFDRKIANAILERLGWSNGMLHVTVTSDEVSKGRPYPDMIFRAMELTGVGRSEHVMKVGDTLSDLQEGKAAGCGYVVGITTGAYTKEQLVTGYHTHLIDDLREIIDIV